ncbi:MAG: MBL fold metallo-hydrolase, partial [Chloroflexi bacterium]|nr:MBL fold metallo-hydrolase [Chloroflexota bacterium]
KRVIERALERRALIVSVHAPYPGLGRLRLEDGKRRWEPLDGQGR